jgi:hypothetical protein
VHTTKFWVNKKRGGFFLSTLSDPDIFVRERSELQLIHKKFSGKRWNWQNKKKKTINFNYGIKFCISFMSITESFS